MALPAELSLPFTNTATHDNVKLSASSAARYAITAAILADVEAFKEPIGSSFERDERLVQVSGSRLSHFAPFVPKWTL